MSSETNGMAELKSKLLPRLEKRMPHAENLCITDIKKPGMGISSETYLLELAYDSSGQRHMEGMVLRTAPQDSRVFPEYDLRLQFRIMELLKDTNVPVARMYWLEEDPSILGAPFFLMERFHGEVPQDYPPYHGSGMFFDATPAERAKMWWGGLEAMADVHKLDWQGLAYPSWGYRREARTRWTDSWRTGIATSIGSEMTRRSPTRPWKSLWHGSASTGTRRNA